MFCFIYLLWRDMARVDGSGNQPLFFVAEEPNRFQRLKDWVLENPHTIAKVGLVFVAAVGSWALACALVPAIGLGIGLGVGITLGFGAMVTIPFGLFLMGRRN